MTTSWISRVADWYSSPNGRRIACLISAIIVGISAVRGIALRQNDFLWHLDFGQQFLAGTPYRNSTLDTGYLLGRALFDAGLASLNYYLSRAVVYLAALLALYRTLIVWSDLAQEFCPLAPPFKRLSRGLAVIALSPYLFRDFDDCGLHVLFLFFLTMGIVEAHRYRGLSSGFWFAAAVTFKTTGALCVPFLLLKRQWQTVMWTTLFLILLNVVAPACFLGWAKVTESNQHVLTYLARIMNLQHPIEETLDAAKPQNQSLLAALARYLRTYPDGHVSVVRHPMFIQFGKIDAEEVAIVSKLVIIFMVVGIAWWFRKPWAQNRGNARFSKEWAAVCVFTAILSPLCWLHHLVLTLPAMLLLMWTMVAKGGTSRSGLLLVGSILAITLFLHRELVGKELQLLMLSYKVHTLAALCMLVAILTMIPDRWDQASQSQKHPSEKS